MGLKLAFVHRVLSNFVELISIKCKCDWRPAMRKTAHFKCNRSPPIMWGVCKPDYSHCQPNTWKAVNASQIPSSMRSTFPFGIHAAQVVRTLTNEMELHLKGARP